MESSFAQRKAVRRAGRRREGCRRSVGSKLWESTSPRTAWQKAKSTLTSSPALPAGPRGALSFAKSRYSRKSLFQVERGQVLHALHRERRLSVEQSCVVGTTSEARVNSWFTVVCRMPTISVPGGMMLRSGYPGGLNNTGTKSMLASLPRMPVTSVGTSLRRMGTSRRWRRRRGPCRSRRRG